MCRGLQRPEEGISSLELMRILKTELVSSGKTLNVSDHWAISPILITLSFQTVSLTVSDIGWPESSGYLPVPASPELG